MIIIVFHQNKLTKLLLNATHCSFPVDLQVIKGAETLVLQRESRTTDLNSAPEGSGQAGAKSCPEHGRLLLHRPCPQRASGGPPVLLSPASRACPCSITRRLQTQDLPSLRGVVAPVTFPHWPCPPRPSAGLGTTSQPAANSPAPCFATEQWPPPPFPVAADGAGAGIGHCTRWPLVISHRSCAPGLLTPSTPNYVAQSPHAGREPRPSPRGWATAWAPWAHPALAAPVPLLCLPQGWGARGSHGCSLFSSPSKRLLSSQENCIPPPSLPSQARDPETH